MINKKNRQGVSTDGEEGYLITAIAWQESLLQAYRNYLLITQSIMIAVDVGILSAQASAQIPIEEHVYSVLFIVIFLLGTATLVHLNNAIIERARAVDWWQRRLLQHENALSGSGHFIAFRIAKEHSFMPPEIEAHQLNPKDIERLLRAETPKARMVFRIFIPGIVLIWTVLLVSASLNLWQKSQ